MIAAIVVAIIDTHPQIAAAWFLALAALSLFVRVLRGQAAR